MKLVERLRVNLARKKSRLRSERQRLSTLDGMPSNGANLYCARRLDRFVHAKMKQNTPPVTTLHDNGTKLWPLPLTTNPPTS